MVIDAHTHLGAKTFVGTAEGLVASMDKSGVDVSLVFAGKINGVTNQQLLEAIRPYSGRLYGVGSVSPLEKDAADRDIRKLLESQAIRGLKFYPGYEYFYPYDECVRPFLDVLQSTGRPAIFHGGDTFSGIRASKLKYVHPLHLDEIAVDFPKLKIVIAHFGYPWQNDAAEVVYKNQNVYVDCSGLVYGDFTPESEGDFRRVVDDYVRVAGSTERILFGTDWPIGHQSSYLAVARRVFGDDERIFSGNAQKLFGL
jgi:hypothetical protein